MAKIIKPLSELQISPSPWYINDHASVLDRDCVIISGQYGPFNWHNARLLAASPKLYDELWKLCFGEHTGSVNCRNCKGAELGNCEKCNLGGARAALLEASMEYPSNDEEKCDICKNAIWHDGIVSDCKKEPIFDPGVPKDHKCCNGKFEKIETSKKEYKESEAR